MVLRAAIGLYRLKKNEWLNPKALARLQWMKLKKILRHAYENVPYYHRLFNDAGIRPEDIKNRDDLSKIPITTKSKIQGLAPEEIIARGIDRSKCIELRTSGSTGRPLSVFLTKKEKEFFAVVWARAFMGAGMNWKDKRLHVVGLVSENPPEKYWFQRLGIMRRQHGALLDGNGQVFEVLEQGNIDILSSQPSILKLIIEHLVRKGCSRLHPRLVFTVAEVLDASTRQQIENFFHAPLFDFYGLTEVGLIAWECAPHHGFHLNVDNQLVEFLRKGKRVPAGKRGKIIATSLHSYAMPFIRYDTEDVGILSRKRCPCGRGLPVLQRLEGRCDDFVSLPNGRHFPPQVFRRIMRTVPGVEEYKVIQERRDRILIYMVIKKAFPMEICKAVREKVESALGKDLKIRFNVVDDIPLDRSGKLRSVISYVPVDF